MSVAYEPRSFMNDGSYPTIGDEHDHGADHRYTDSDVAEHLSHYTADAAMLQDDRDVMDDERAMMGDDSGVVDDSTRLDLGPTGFSSPIHMPMQPQTTAAALQMPDPHAPMPDDAGSNHGSHNGTVVHKTESPAPPALGESPSTHQSSSRSKTMPKPDREVVKQADGKFHCPLHDCKEEVRSFSRKCEWNKHMDKHERPYRCLVEGCESLPGFTYSGGLLRHEREVHGKHGGPKKTVNCPHTNCKRHTGKGFSRLENLNEHLRRVHTANDGSSPSAGASGNTGTNANQQLGGGSLTIGTSSPSSPGDNDSERSGAKRKRRSSGSDADEMTVLRDEIKRVREENDKLKSEMEQQTQHSISMMSQIAELQDALRHGLAHTSLGGGTAQLI